MFTKNFWNAFEKLSNTLRPNTNDAYISFVNTSGNTITDMIFSTNTADYTSFPGFNLGAITGQYNYNVVAAISLKSLFNGSSLFTGNNSIAYSNHGGVILGDGDGIPTENDFKLFGNMITTFTATTSLSVNTANGLEYIALYNITNTGNTDITIKEIAARYSGYSHDIIAEHTVLSSPLTIGAGETKTLVYRISFGGSSAQAI